jgi:hypothetical protein
LVRRQRDANRAVAANRALVMALWEARRLRARALCVQLDDATLIGQLDGTEPVPQEILASHLQIRALLHAFRSVELHYSPDDADVLVAAAAAARVAHPNRASCADLPLWAAAS